MSAARGAEVSKLVAFLRLKFEMPTVAKDRHIPHGGSDKDHYTEFQKPPVLAQEIFTGKYENLFKRQPKQTLHGPDAGDHSVDSSLVSSFCISIVSFA